MLFRSCLSTLPMGSIRHCVVNLVVGLLLATPGAHVFAEALRGPFPMTVLLCKEGSRRKVESGLAC